MTINLLLWLFLRFFIECFVGGLVTGYAFYMVCEVMDAKFERILNLVNFASIGLLILKFLVHKV
jgi:hypothetical protein